MKTQQIASTAVLFFAAAQAKPTYPAPPGGWESIKYPAGTGENLPYYPAPKGGWESIKYPAGTGENLPYYPPAQGGKPPAAAPADPPAACPPASGSGPFTFTSTYSVIATPDQVINGTEPTGGLPGAIGYYDFGINSEMNFICYNIRLEGVTGDYSSPADTATHIHEADRGSAGPPRISLTNPVTDASDPNVRKIVGCQMGPFVTGLEDDDTGMDTGAGFTVSEIEANPAAFFADVHTTDAVPGAVRGQIA